MPARFERHARPKSEDWGPQPPRSAEVAGAAAEQLRPESRRPPGRKDPTACKAAHWGPHQPQIKVRQGGWPQGRDCKWDVAWSRDEPSWFCYHEEVCAGCGKILRGSVEEQECPVFRPLTPEKRTAIFAEIERRRRQLEVSRARYRPPPPTGRQGYRRRRSA
jgi:hypothetical protein